MIKIVPAILAYSKEEFWGKVEQVKDLVDWVQVDVYQGLYWDFDIPFKVEAHVMLESPNLEDFREADRIIVHQGVVSFANRDYALVLAVEPGRAGQKFKPEILDTVTGLRQDNPNIDIAVDGGVNLDNCQQIVKAGANILVVGSYLFGAPQIKNALHRLHDKCLEV